MAVKGKRDNDSAPNPRSTRSRSKAETTATVETVDADNEKTIGDFKPENDGNGGVQGAPDGDEANQSDALSSPIIGDAPADDVDVDGFSSDPNHNPNILPGSPHEFDKRAEVEGDPNSPEGGATDNAATGSGNDGAGDKSAAASSEDGAGGELSEEMKKKIIRTPRTPPLPTMESNGDPELEAMAVEHEDIENTIKTMNKRKNTLKDQMLNKLRKANLTMYSHDGFIIEREEKGETVKVKSVKVSDE
jgi:hypothetical protein